MPKSDVFEMVEAAQQKAQSSVVPIVEGDLRLQTLMRALSDVVAERGVGIPCASVVGVLEVLKAKYIQDYDLCD